MSKKQSIQHKIVKTMKQVFANKHKYLTADQIRHNTPQTASNTLSQQVVHQTTQALFYIIDSQQKSASSATKVRPLPSSSIISKMDLNRRQNTATHTRTTMPKAAAQHSTDISVPSEASVANSVLAASSHGRRTRQQGALNTDRLSHRVFQSPSASAPSLSAQFGQSHTSTPHSLQQQFQNETSLSDSREDPAAPSFKPEHHVKSVNQQIQNINDAAELHYRSSLPSVEENTDPEVAGSSFPSHSTLDQEAYETMEQRLETYKANRQASLSEQTAPVEKVTVRLQNHATANEVENRLPDTHSYVSVDPTTTTKIPGQSELPKLPELPEQPKAESNDKRHRKTGYPGDPSNTLMLTKLLAETEKPYSGKKHQLLISSVDRQWYGFIDGSGQVYESPYSSRYKYVINLAPTASSSVKVPLYENQQLKPHEDVVKQRLGNRTRVK